MAHAGLSAGGEGGEQEEKASRGPLPSECSCSAVLQVADGDLLRDIFGNPFRPVAAEPSWTTWNGGVVVKLAGSTYEGRAFERLPVLADALEEAGCTDADLLAHCRGGGEHVRGCWVVDLLLGKS